jgi:hypothetical protein
MKDIGAREPPVAEVEPEWNSLWGEEAWRDEGGEWIRRRDRRKISNMGFMSIKYGKRFFLPKITG